MKNKTYVISNQLNHLILINAVGLFLIIFIYHNSLSGYLGLCTFNLIYISRIKAIVITKQKILIYHFLNILSFKKVFMINEIHSIWFYVYPMGKSIVWIRFNNNKTVSFVLREISYKKIIKFKKDLNAIGIAAGETHINPFTGKNEL